MTWNIHVLPHSWFGKSVVSPQPQVATAAKVHLIHPNGRALHVEYSLAQLLLLSGFLLAPQSKQDPALTRGQFRRLLWYSRYHTLALLLQWTRRLPRILYLNLADLIVMTALFYLMLRYWYFS